MLLAPVPELPPTLSLPGIGGNFSMHYNDDGDLNATDKKRKLSESEDETTGIGWWRTNYCIDT